MKRLAAPAVVATLALLAAAPGADATTTTTSAAGKATSCTRLPLLIPICKTEQRKVARTGRCGYRVLFIPICRQ